jgi:hypothetical protein
MYRATAKTLVDSLHGRLWVNRYGFGMRRKTPDDRNAP